MRCSRWPAPVSIASSRCSGVRSTRVASGPSRSKRRVVLATLNPGKVRELAQLLGDLPIELVGLADIQGAWLPPETGTTYAENALIKARAGGRLTVHAALGDASGLEIDALGGVPGLHSARFGGRGLDDRGRTNLLLERLRAVPAGKRRARFRCVIAVIDEAGGERTVEGVAEGEIALLPRGDGGFGYDPVFFFPPLGRTFGELSDGEKERVSHRALAARAARALLTGGYTPEPNPPIVFGKLEKEHAMTDRPDLVIDGDGHVIEVDETYERIDPKYRERRPVYTQASRGYIVRLVDGKVWGPDTECGFVGVNGNLGPPKGKAIH